MSRIRFTEGSSDDELDKLIKKREKRLQKRKDDIKFSYKILSFKHSRVQQIKQNS